MSVSKNICVISGSRADYGLLAPVMRAINAAPDFTLSLILTGMHLDPVFGSTDEAVITDGFTITHRVETGLNDDSGYDIAKSVGRGVTGFAECFEASRPDMVMVLGDRFEILAAAQAALLMRIPLAHICGGDVTEGAIDDAMRHAITKMAGLHFPMTDESATRLHQMGEDPERIFCAGNPALDDALALTAAPRTEIEEALSFKFHAKNILITYHPATLGVLPPEQAFQNVLDALATCDSDVGLIFTAPNADHDGRIVLRMIEGFVTNTPQASLVKSMGNRFYWSCLHHVDMVLGNSSSGLLEVPAFACPTINIGTRQTGRLKAASVIDSDEDVASIQSAIQSALTLDCSAIKNPYGDGQASARIIDALSAIPDFKALLQKSFQNIKAS